jgi:sugar phosphate isomerase/epimerase
MHNQKTARIGISTWSFHNLFTQTRDDDAPPISGKPMDARDFPDMIADRYHVHEMEIVAPHISPEPSYIRDLKTRLDRAHSHLVNIPVDIEELGKAGGLSDTDARVREKAISACTKWMDIAHELGARSVRCDPGKINTADLSPTIASYKALAAYGASKNIFVIIENHGGVGSEHPEELVELFKGVGKNCGALPDFGNFPDEATRRKGLKLLFPYGRTVCHAKGLKFDDKGNETMFDFAQCVKTSKAAGFKGVYSIEFEGEGDPHIGVQHVVDELLRYL